jgi:hypothetical protein
MDFPGALESSWDMKDMKDSREFGSRDYGGEHKAGGGSGVGQHNQHSQHNQLTDHSNTPHKLSPPLSVYAKGSAATSLGGAPSLSLGKGNGRSPPLTPPRSTPTGM